VEDTAMNGISTHQILSATGFQYSFSNGSEQVNVKIFVNIHTFRYASQSLPVPIQWQTTCRWNND